MKTIKTKNDSEVPDKFTGKVKYEYGHTWYLINGIVHRLDGPAYTGYDPVCCKEYKAYWINGKIIRNIHELNDKDYEQYFYNSKEYKQTILLENMKRIKNIT